MIESIYIEAFLLNLLREDVLLTGPEALDSTARADRLIFNSHARQGAPCPLMIVSLLRPRDIHAGNKERLFVENAYIVKTVGEVRGVDLLDAPRVRTTAHRGDELLKEIRQQPFTVDGVTFNFNTWRKQELPRYEVRATGDTFYRMYGGIYVVQAFH